MNRYDDFWCITEESLDYSMDYFNIKNEILKTKLLKSYQNISCYEEIPKILSKLKERKISTAILSNASPNMLNIAIKNSKIDCYIDHCFSVDNLKIYKPHPSVYNLVLETGQTHEIYKALILAISRVLTNIYKKPKHIEKSVLVF